MSQFGFRPLHRGWLCDLLSSLYGFPRQLGTRILIAKGHDYFTFLAVGLVRSWGAEAGKVIQQEAGYERKTHEYCQDNYLGSFTLCCRLQFDLTKNTAYLAYSLAYDIFPAGGWCWGRLVTLVLIVIIGAVTIEIRGHIRFDIIEDYPQDIAIHIFQLDLGSIENSPPNATHLVHQDDPIHFRRHLEGVGHWKHRGRVHNDNIVVISHLMQELFKPGWTKNFSRVEQSLPRIDDVQIIHSRSFQDVFKCEVAEHHIDDGVGHVLPAAIRQLEFRPTSHLQFKSIFSGGFWFADSHNVVSEPGLSLQAERIMGRWSAQISIYEQHFFPSLSQTQAEVDHIVGLPLLQGWTGDQKNFCFSVLPEKLQIRPQGAVSFRNGWAWGKMGYQRPVFQWFSIVPFFFAGELINSWYNPQYRHAKDLLHIFDGTQWGIHGFHNQGQD